MDSKNRYERIIEKIFFEKYTEGVHQVDFERDDIVRVAHEEGIKLPKNLGDLVYSFRYRTALPESIRNLAPEGRSWLIRPAGRSKYKFIVTKFASITPNPALAETKVPDSTPGIIEMYALNDEQALLAKMRYNRLIDVFTGVTCYSLQSHLRTTVRTMGQVETDEIYVGLDHRGVQYVFPVQAKGARDSLNVVQIEQDLAMCSQKFPHLICRPVGAQFIHDDVIALFILEDSDEGIVITSERHYRLTPPEEISREDLESYRLPLTDGH